MNTLTITEREMLEAAVICEYYAIICCENIIDGLTEKYGKPFINELVINMKAQLAQK